MPTEELTLIAQHLVQALAGEGQEGSEQHFEIIDHAQNDIYRRSGSGSIFLDLKPGSFVVQINIGRPGDAHHLFQSSF